MARITTPQEIDTIQKSIVPRPMGRTSAWYFAGFEAPIHTIKYFSLDTQNWGKSRNGCPYKIPHLLRAISRAEACKDLLSKCNWSMTLEKFWTLRYMYFGFDLHPLSWQTISAFPRIMAGTWSQKRFSELALRGSFSVDLDDSKLPKIFLSQDNRINLSLGDIWTLDRINLALLSFSLKSRTWLSLL